MTENNDSYSPLAWWVGFFTLFALGVVAAVYFYNTGDDLALLATLLGTPGVLMAYMFKTGGLSDSRDRKQA